MNKDCRQNGHQLVTLQLHGGMQAVRVILLQMTTGIFQMNTETLKSLYIPQSHLTCACITCISGKMINHFL